MPTFLFDEIIFGPVRSRRLGNSLGINLLPTHAKYCNFNCLYCECGLTARGYGKHSRELPARAVIRQQLEASLRAFREKQQPIDAITFAGNGEPTMHPDFPGIIDDTLALRDRFFPKAAIAVLSNATLIGRNAIREALLKVDHNILKLDSAMEETVRRINCPIGEFSMEQLVTNLSAFTSKLTIQTLFVKGNYQGATFDNSSDEEVAAWLKLIARLKPELVMVYTIARDTPVETLQKVTPERLEEIAGGVRKLGIQVSVST